MPITPLHLGPGSVAGLLFRRWLDLPVFLLGNLVVDIEVWIAAYMKVGPLPIRYGHTLLIASAVGLLTGLLCYPFKGVFQWIMSKIRLPYTTGLKKMLISGALGAWLHVLLDGLYRANVVLFWPSRIYNPLCRFDKTDVETACWIMLVAGALIYLFLSLSKRDVAPH